MTILNWKDPQNIFFCFRTASLGGSGLILEFPRNLTLFYKFEGLVSSQFIRSCLQKYNWKLVFQGGNKKEATWSTGGKASWDETRLRGARYEEKTVPDESFLAYRALPVILRGVSRCCGRSRCSLIPLFWIVLSRYFFVYCETYWSRPHLLGSSVSEIGRITFREGKIKRTDWSSIDSHSVEKQSVLLTG